MRTFYLAIAINLIIVYPTDAQSPSFEIQHKKSYHKALMFIKENKRFFLLQFKDTLEALIASTIIFPELVRFEGLQDYAETKSLEVLYVDYGSSYGNFSIGRFQMKPAFIETLEKEITQKKIKKFYRVTSFETRENIKQVRLQRIQRLSHAGWQLLYLAAFIEVMYQKYPHWFTYPLLQRIELLAAAYNLGFQQSEQKIKAWINQKAFPLGMNHPNSFSYASIALEFYNTYGLQIFKKD